MDSHESIRWVVALRPEAQPIIDHFELIRNEKMSRGGYPVFKSENSDCRMVLSGIGKVNAAAATAWLAAQEAPGPRAVLWLNFGIGGSGGFKRGEVCRADRVMDPAIGRAWYPQAVWKRKHDLPGGTIISVPEPTNVYPEDGAVLDMEAAGFVPIALKFASTELVQVVKVISDGPDHPMEEIRPPIVEELCRDGLQEMLPWLEAVSPFLAAEQSRLSEPEDFQEILGRWHFSSTQTHQLSRLLHQWRAKKPNDPILTNAVLAGSRNARAFLAGVRTILWG